MAVEPETNQRFSRHPAIGLDTAHTLGRGPLHGPAVHCAEAGTVITRIETCPWRRSLGGMRRRTDVGDIARAADDREQPA